MYYHDKFYFFSKIRILQLSKALATATKRSVTSIKGRQFQSTSVLRAASSVELQESSTHNPPPKNVEKTLVVATELAVTSAAADTTASPPIVATTGGSGASTSLAFAVMMRFGIRGRLGEKEQGGPTLSRPTRPNVTGQEAYNRGGIKDNY
jgi:hypothetical protein